MIERRRNGVIEEKSMNYKDTGEKKEEVEVETKEGDERVGDKRRRYNCKNAVGEDLRNKAKRKEVVRESRCDGRTLF